ncbi:hypothetical protein H4582DRAFT_2099415 [Lactarius indigo]|nr:hypothetical protein H4582DRAFT_2099415 [Lactarius indigo]
MASEDLIVQVVQEKGLKEKYWGVMIENPKNLGNPARARVAFAADPLNPGFLQRRQSLAATPIRDLRTPLSGFLQLRVEVPVTEVDFLQTHEPQGFLESSFSVTHEDPSVGVYFTGWNSVEARYGNITSLCKQIRWRFHMRIGIEEGHENFKEEAENSRNN